MIIKRNFHAPRLMLFKIHDKTTFLYFKTNIQNIPTIIPNPNNFQLFIVIPIEHPAEHPTKDKIHPCRNARHIRTARFQTHDQESNVIHPARPSITTCIIALIMLSRRSVKRLAVG